MYKVGIASHCIHSRMRKDYYNTIIHTSDRFIRFALFFRIVVICIDGAPFLRNSFALLLFAVAVLFPYILFSINSLSLCFFLFSILERISSILSL